MPARPEFKSEELSQTGRNPLCRVLLMEGDGVPSLRCPPANRHPVSEKAPSIPHTGPGPFPFHSSAIEPVQKPALGTRRRWVAQYGRTGRGTRNWSRWQPALGTFFDQLCRHRRFKSTATAGHRCRGMVGRDHLPPTTVRLCVAYTNRRLNTVAPASVRKQ